LVTPDQAELLSLASNQAKIQLVLRNPLDTRMAHPPGTAMAALFSDGVKPVVSHRAPPPPAARIYLIEVFNGAKRTEEKFVAAEAKQ